MASRGTYPNPAFKSCWRTCQSCFRCENKMKYDSNYNGCRGCSGRFDMYGVTDPHEDDQCRCAEGVLQYVKSTGEFKQVRFKHNPFNVRVKQIEESEDERDFERYVDEKKKKYDMETFQPIEVYESE